MWCSASLECLSNSKLKTPRTSTAATPEPTTKTARFGAALPLAFATFVSGKGRLEVAIFAKSDNDAEGRPDMGRPENTPAVLPSWIVGLALPVLPLRP